MHGQPHKSSCDNRPAAPPSGPDGIMMFDGDCNFCSMQVKLLLALDKAGVIRFTPFRSEYGRYLCERIGINAETPSTFLFFNKGRALEASDAVIAILARLPFPWRIGTYTSVIPRFIRNALYYAIARNRFRLMGRSDACLVPSMQLQARFVTDIPSE